MGKKEKSGRSKKLQDMLGKMPEWKKKQRQGIKKYAI
jgi:hypothetical protein